MPLFEKVCDALSASALKGQYGELENCGALEAEGGVQIPAHPPSSCVTLGK